jgi:hypothetical protein
MPSEYGGVAVPKPSKFDRVAQKRRDKLDEDAAWVALCKAVDLRDKRECRCCGRSGKVDGAASVLERLHRHHIQYRSASGEDTLENVLILCSFCHLAEHAGQLTLIGTNANEVIDFEIVEAAVVHIFGRQELPKHCHIVLPSGDRRI